MDEFDLMRVSVVATVYNEGHSIRTLMDSLLNQTRQPDETIICDGGSRDDTVAILREYRGKLPDLRILCETGANISQGRNRAISEANGPIIATTDAGVRLDAHWLERLVAPLEAGRGAKEGKVEAAAGFFVPEASGPFQLAMGATVLPQADEIVPSRFLPSSRCMAFFKELWQRVGGFPEWLDYCEDLVFDLRIKATANEEETAFAWAPQAVVFLPAPYQPEVLLAAVFPICERRWQGRPLAATACHPLRYLSATGSGASRPRAVGPGGRVVGLAWTGTWGDRQLRKPLAAPFKAE